MSGLEHLAFAALYRVRERFLEFRDARQLHLLDGLPGRALDDVQQVALTRRDEQNRLPAAAGSAGTANAVNVGLRVVRGVKVDDVGDPFNVESSGSDISSDDDVDLSGLEAGDRALAPLLWNIPVQCRRR